MSKFYLLVDSAASHDLLARILSYLSTQKPEQINLILLSDQTEQVQLLKDNTLRFLYLNQAFISGQAKPVQTYQADFFLEHNPPEQNELWLLCPQSVNSSEDTQSINATDLEIEISEKMESLLSEYSERIMLDEEQLEQALMAPHSSLISHENHRVELQASLKQALNAQHQNLLNIQTLTYFLHLQLHKKPWSLELRPLLHQALQRISEEPQNEYLHFVLAAFRRKHRNFAALSQHWDHEKQKMRGFITQEIKHSIGICAAPKDWRVAIFMPTYNRLEEFKEAIQCILEQSYSNWEVHIYDDASKDQTEQFAQKIAQSDPRIHYHKNPVNQGFFGIHKSYRHMAEMTQCELITALADDDRWELNHLEKLVHVFQKTPWVAQVYAPMWLVQNKTQIMGQFGPFAHQESILDTQTELDNALVLDMCPVGAIFRSELIAEFAAFDITSQRHFGQSYAAWDYMFHIKLLAHYEMAQYIHPSVHFNIGGSTGSKNWDASEDLFFLLEQLLQDYAKLFDGDHPPTELIHHFVQRRVDGMTRQFHEILRNTQSKQEWDKFVKHQKRIWQQAAQLLETYSLN